MKHTHAIIVILLTLVAVSCQTVSKSQSLPETNQEVIEGELMFKLISFGSLYGASDSEIKKFDQMIDSLKKEEDLPENYQMFLADHQLLKDHGVLYKPYFYLKADSAKVFAVFLDGEAYLKIKDFELNQLQNENKKVIIKLAGYTIREGLFSCASILETNKVDGKTYWEK